MRFLEKLLLNINSRISLLGQSLPGQCRRFTLLISLDVNRFEIVSLKSDCDTLGRVYF
jgi:hypothetical protein